MSEDNGATWTMVSNTDGYDAPTPLKQTRPTRIGCGMRRSDTEHQRCVGGGAWRRQQSQPSDVAIAPDGYCLVAESTDASTVPSVVILAVCN